MAITEFTDVDTVQLIYRQVLGRRTAQATRTSNMWITTCAMGHWEFAIADSRLGDRQFGIHDIGSGDLSLGHSNALNLEMWNWTIRATEFHSRSPDSEPKPFAPWNARSDYQSTYGKCTFATTMDHTHDSTSSQSPYNVGMRQLPT